MCYLGHHNFWVFILGGFLELLFNNWSEWCYWGAIILYLLLIYDSFLMWMVVPSVIELVLYLFISILINDGCHGSVYRYVVLMGFYHFFVHPHSIGVIVRQFFSHPCSWKTIHPQRWLVGNNIGELPQYFCMF